MKKLITCLMALTQLTAFAASPDIFSSDPNVKESIKVTRSPENKIKFEYCDDVECQPIGRKSGYNKAELEELRTMEYLQVGGAVVADAAIIVGLFYGGILLIEGAGAAGLVSTGGFEGAILGWGTGAGTSIVGSPILISAIDAVNPKEQYKQAATLDDDILEDKNVVIDDLYDFKNRLSLVLDKLED